MACRCGFYLAYPNKKKGKNTRIIILNYVTVDSMKCTSPLLWVVSMDDDGEGEDNIVVVGTTFNILPHLHWL